MAKIQLEVQGIQEWEHQVSEVCRLADELRLRLAGLTKETLKLEAKINQTPEDTDA